MADEGFIPLQSPIIPANRNPRAYVTEGRYIRGIDQTFQDINKLVEFHPNKMGGAGVAYRVRNYPATGQTSTFILNKDPLLLLDSNNESIVTLSNFRTYYDLEETINSSRSRVEEYAPNGPGGGAPAYPYTPTSEVTAGWEPIYDPAKNHRWVRFRDDDEDLNSDGVFDNWTVPIPAGQAYAPQDFIDVLFTRVAVDQGVKTGLGQLTVNKYYKVLVGSIVVNGDDELARVIGADTNGDVLLTVGRTFQFKGGPTYSFNVGASVRETIATPSRTDANGNPNNNPVGYSNTIPPGTDQLFKISGQKSVYGQLKSEWLLQRVDEDPNYIRYGNINAIYPGTIVDRNTTVVAGDANDLALIAEGWNRIYNGEIFIATRRDDPGPNLYTDWLVEKIDEESGEFIDRAFKLFPINLDPDDALLDPPTNSDASLEGFNDTPLEETTTLINYITEARKFSDGTLKSQWSRLKPWTGKSIFNDTIDGTDNSFKISGSGISPAQIQLSAYLFSGVNRLWEDSDVTITYDWRKVFDNGAAVDVQPTDLTTDDFYRLPASGTPGTTGYLRANQRVVIKPGAVTGKAVFRCTQTLAVSSGDDIVFTEEYTINDVSDGIDAKSYVIRAENQRFLYDSTNTVFSPAAVVLRGYNSNIPSPTYNWYRRDGAFWTKLTGGETGYTITGSILSIDLATATLFAANSSAEEARFALSTDGTDPDNFDNETIFSDFVTIAKTSAAAVGVPGENATIALLDNEFHAITINNLTGQPFSGEIGAAGKAKTKLEVFDGDTKLVFGAGNDYTIELAVSGNMTASSAVNGNDVDIFINSFTQAFPGSATVTITITIGAKVLTKVFSVSTVQDPAGAIQLNIASDRGFSFTPADRANKTLTAELFDTNRDPQLQTSGYEYRWNISGVWTTWTSVRTRVISRSDVFISEDIILEARIVGEVSALRSYQVRINDIVDSKAFILYHTGSTEPARPAATIDPVVGDVTWTPDSTNGIWASFGTEREGVANEYDWSDPIKIKGEEGIPGAAGNTFHRMWRASSTEPAFGAGGNTSTLAQMKAAGWSSIRPSSGSIWQTERLWIGEGLTYDVNEDPSTGPVPGSIWQPPDRLSGEEAIPVPGQNGTNGWNPVLGLVTVGNGKYIRLLDWFGGSGSKPGNIGRYMGSSGYVTGVSQATNLLGDISDAVIVRITGFNLMNMGSSARSTIDNLPIGGYLLVTTNYRKGSPYSSPISGRYGISFLPGNNWIFEGTILRKTNSTGALQVESHGPGYYVAPRVKKSTGSRSSTSESTFGSGLIQIRTLTVQNNWHTTRIFKAKGEIKARRQSSGIVVYAELRIVAPSTVLDRTTHFIEVVEGLQKLPALEGDVSIPAGQSRTLGLSMRQVNSGGGPRRGTGYLEAEGVESAWT